MPYNEVSTHTHSTGGVFVYPPGHVSRQGFVCSNIIKILYCFLVCTPIVINWLFLNVLKNMEIEK